MKVTALSLTLINLCASLSSATTPCPGEAFYLKVVGGNDLTSGAVLRDNNTYDLGVTPPPYYNNAPYGDHPSPIYISTSNSSEVLIAPTNPHPGPIAGRLALVSNGTGDWTLSKAFPQPGGEWNVGPNRDNATVKVVGWEFKDAIWNCGTTVLRWSDPTCSGRWVAVKTTMVPYEGNPYVRWALHWFEVMPSNIDSLGEYMPVDLEVSSTP
ncbi:hypothetical protein CC78DRAFT_538165 [Lojkania enalia]|uniref:Uncharacterized protein n=1 Tax=Lojkania enalia TaxID=147567 RepID=A0A9P4N0R4_9PLEO|nr:hypothetical protein CC78DRAFT_538165 [Didymosphaeria enalia]